MIDGSGYSPGKMAFGQLSACDASGNAANEAAARHIAIARRKRHDEGGMILPKSCAATEEAAHAAL